MGIKPKKQVVNSNTQSQEQPENVEVETSKVGSPAQLKSQAVLLKEQESDKQQKEADQNAVVGESSVLEPIVDKVENPATLNSKKLTQCKKDSEISKAPLMEGKVASNEKQTLNKMTELTSQAEDSKPSVQFESNKVECIEKADIKEGVSSTFEASISEENDESDEKFFLNLANESLVDDIDELQSDEEKPSTIAKDAADSKEDEIENLLESLKLA